LRSSSAFPAAKVHALCIIIIEPWGMMIVSPAIAITDATDAAMPSM